MTAIVSIGVQLFQAVVAPFMGALYERAGAHGPTMCTAFLMQSTHEHPEQLSLSVHDRDGSVEIGKVVGKCN